MNLEERMAFRRELLFETVRTTLSNRHILLGSYRFKIMRTDKRGHCYAVMVDMSPALMDSECGQHRQLADTAIHLTQNARTRYGLVVSGVYWRLDEAIDMPVAGWARSPSTSAYMPLSPLPDPKAPPEPPIAAAPVSEHVEGISSNVERYQQATAKELAAYEDAWQKSRDIQIGNRTYSSDLAPLA